MKPISQTTRYDCLRACIASILELDIDYLPPATEADVADINLWRRYEDYTLTAALRKLNVELFSVTINDGCVPPRGYVIANCWESKRAYELGYVPGHAVVYYRHREVWNPMVGSPAANERGTLRDTSFVYSYTLLLPIDPTKPMGLTPKRLRNLLRVQEG